MAIEQAALEEFKMLYFKEYGKKLSNEQAYEYGTKLIGLVKLVYGSNVPKKWVYKVDRKKVKKVG